MVNNFAVQPYPLWALIREEGVERTVRVVGWVVRRTEVRPVVHFADVGCTDLLADGVDYRLLGQP
jgi:hypothetical protein